MAGVKGQGQPPTPAFSKLHASIEFGIVIARVPTRDAQQQTSRRAPRPSRE